jgi:hypothetical protein
MRSEQKMSRSTFNDIEERELIQKLIDNGHGDLVETLLTCESEVYTKKGRLNKSGACRALEWKAKQLDDELAECKKLLDPDLGED